MVTIKKHILIISILVLITFNHIDVFSQSQNIANAGKPAILFIHGLAGSHATWKKLMANLPDDSFRYIGNIEVANFSKTKFKISPSLTKQAYYTTEFPCFTMDFSDNQNLLFDEQGDEVALAVDKIIQLTGRQSVILFGHSMGGLAARAYINKYGAKNVVGYVSASTPHLGSFIGEIQNIYNDPNTSKETKKIIDRLFFLARLEVKLDQNAKVIKELSPCSQSLQALNSKPFPVSVPIDIVISNYKLDNTNSDLINIYNKLPVYITLSLSFDDFITIISNMYNTVLTTLSTYANANNCSSPLNTFSMNLQNQFTDLVVPVISQNIRLAVPNGIDLNPNYYYSNKFHDGVTKDIKAMQDALIDITRKADAKTKKPRKFIGLILDSSGSMKESDPNSARIKTAKKIIQLLTGNELVFVVDFDDNAKWINENNYDDWNITRLNKQLNTIDSDGGTNIGISLLKMKEAISNKEYSNIKGGVILFTDGKGLYKDEANWYQEHNIPIYTISFTENGDALLLNKIAAITGGQYLLAKDETEAINALDYFFSKLYDYNQFFSENSIIHPFETKTFPFYVDNLTKRLLASVGWLHSTIELSLISPSGKIYSNHSVLSENKSRVEFFNSDNFASYKIINAEKGKWTARLYGKDIPTEGESFVFNASGDSPYAITLNTTVDTNSGIINFNFSGLEKSAQIDLTATTPSFDTIKISKTQVNDKLTFLPSNGIGNYNFKISLSSVVDNNRLTRQYYKSILIGNNVSSNVGSVQSIMGTLVTINIGQWAGNFPGLQCYIYDPNNKLLARGYVVGVKSTHSMITLVEYYTNEFIRVGYPVRLDYKQWLNDN